MAAKIFKAHWSFWSIARWCAFVLLVVVIGLLALENYRGHHEWRKYRHEWEAKGETFDLGALIPAPVPPEQNFATTPFFSPFLDYIIDHNDPITPYKRGSQSLFEANKAKAQFPAPQLQATRRRPKFGQWHRGLATDLALWRDFLGDDTNAAAGVVADEPGAAVLRALRRYDPILDELRVASQRPYSLFPVHYRENFQANISHAQTLKELAHVVALTASAKLSTGDAAGALRDVRLGLRFGEALKHERLLVSTLTRMAILNLMMQPIWEGLNRNQWADQEVLELQELIEPINILEDYAPVMRMERALTLDVIDQMRTGTLQQVAEGPDSPTENLGSTRYLPGGFYHQNSLLIARRFEALLPLVLTNQVRIRAAKEVLDHPATSRFPLYSIFADLLMPGVERAIKRFANSQTSRNLAAVACALERYRLKNNRWPDGLEDLSPSFLPEIPTDIMGGPLHYKVTSQGYMLYAVGWNERDDGGREAPERSARPASEEPDDWVWRIQEPSPRQNVNPPP